MTAFRGQSGACAGGPRSAPAEDRTPQLGQREHVLRVRNGCEHVVLHPLAVEQHTLLVAARAEVAGLARVGEQVAFYAAIVSRMAALPAAPGARYLQQKQLDVAIDAALRLWLAQASEYLGQSLAPHAVDTSELRCHAGTVTGRSERMVFNASFLVADAALAGFRAALALQQQAYAGTGLTLELRGPWPPYNFCPALTTGR